MRIGFDAKRLFLNYTGLGAYSRTLVSNLQKYYPQYEYHLYTPKVIYNKDTEEFFDESKFIIHKSKSILKSYWRSFSIKNDLKRDKIDVFHGLSAELPFGLSNSGIKSVVTIHDLIFKFFPSDYKYLDRLIYDFKSKYACEKADRIISISKITTQDLYKFYKINQDKISVVGLPTNKVFTKHYDVKDWLKVKNKFSLPDKYFLYVGSVIGRKNLKVVIKAISLLDKQHRIPLIVVGSGKKYLDETKNLVDEYKLKGDVVFLQNVDNQDLSIIYRNCEFFVFPSLYEGFGLPVLEALQNFKPVIVSKDTTLEEVAGDCGVVLPFDNVEKWSNAIQDMIAKPLNKTDFKNKCNMQLASFDPKVLSSKIMNVYLE